MRRVIIYIVGVVSLLMVACSSDVTDIDVKGGTAENIYLSAGIETNTSSRVPYELLAPTTDNPLNVNVWATTVRYYYPHEDGVDGSGADGRVALHADAKFQNSTPQLLSKAVYSKENSIPVYFVAFHPQGEWSVNDSKNIASYTFNGSQDVMFASEVSGVYDTDYENSPLLYFRHLNTWLKLEIQAESEEVSIALGELKSITIRSKSKVDVDLRTDFNITTHLTYSEDKNLNFFKPGTNEVFPSTPALIPYSQKEEVGYVLCAPVDASDYDKYGERTTEYVIDIVTANRTLMTVNVDLKSAADTWYDLNTRAKQFTIFLKFNIGNDITVATTINEWKNGGIGSAILDE